MLGSPVFTTLGGAALILFWASGLPIASVALDHYRMVVNPSLPMIPLFTLAGYFLAEGGAPRRLIRVFNALFGGLRGGAAIVTVLACAFFTSFSGASGVTIIALGGMLMPLLLSARATRRSTPSGCSPARARWAACCRRGCRWCSTRSSPRSRSRRCSSPGSCRAC